MTTQSLKDLTESRSHCLTEMPLEVVVMKLIQCIVAGGALFFYHEQRRFGRSRPIRKPLSGTIIRSCRFKTRSACNEAERTNHDWPPTLADERNRFNESRNF